MRPDIKVKGKRNSVIRRRSLNDFTRAMAKAVSLIDDVNSGAVKRGNFSSVTGSKDFTGTESIQEYQDMLLHGWKHGVTDVEGLDGLSTDAAEKLTFVRSVGGAFPIVPAYLAGQPDAMYRPTHHDAETVRGLTLVIDAAFHCGIQSETVLKYAQTVMRMIAWLQAEQIDVSVYVTIGVVLKSKRVTYVTPIREAGDVLQPERVAAILHPSWLRRAYFALLESEFFDYDGTYPEAAACRGGYGSVYQSDPEELKQALPNAYSVIMLPKVGSSNPEAAIREAITLKLKRGD